MPKCKNCGENITKFDKEICPFCGCKNPLDADYTQTSDVTQTLDTLGNEEIKQEFKKHSRLLTSVFCGLGGIFSLDLFYLGFIKEGLIRLGINILFFLVIFLPIGLLLKDSWLLATLLPLGILYLVYIVIGIITFFNHKKKDKNGVFLD